MYMRFLLMVCVSLGLSACMQDQPSPAEPPADAAPMAALGQALFEDSTLSANADHSGPGNQSCASCHDKSAAFTDPDQTIPVSAGAVVGRFGTRNSPTVSYAAFAPTLSSQLDDGELLWSGGLFLDGRVNTLEEQAGKPFLNEMEMNNASVAEVIGRLRASPNAVTFLQVFGADALDPGKEDRAFAQLTQAIAAFERTPAVSPFNARFDAYLAGSGTLNPLEIEGMSLFIRADKGGCAACHVMTRGAKGEPPLFTDFTYDNLGVPRNTNTLFYPVGFVDEGITPTLTARNEDGSRLRGKFRVPTLRNIEKTAPYMHNGVFTDLREVVVFYNTRDRDPQRWGDTEVPETVNHDELGNLGLNDHEIDAIVAFMKTLSDRPLPP
jgi:cytochrome c peroxidase